MEQKRQSRPTDRRLTAATIFLAVILLLLLIVPNVISSMALNVGDKIVKETTPLDATSQQILSFMVDQESGLRGYIIAREQQFLDQYNRGRAQLESLWPVAQQQAQVVGGQAPTVLAAVRQSATNWQQSTAQPEIQMVAAGQLQGAEQKVATGQGKELFDKFRTDNTVMSKYIEQTRTDQTNQRNQLLTILEVVLVVLGVAGLIALGIIYYISAVSQQYIVRIAQNEEINRAKDEFLSIASHELKTPITAIKGYAQALLRRAKRVDASAVKPEEWSKTINQVVVIEQQTSRLARMVDDLLDVTRVQIQRFELNCTPTDLVALSSRVSEQLQVTTDHSIGLSADAPQIMVDMDEGRIEQVLYNLISNAIKYSPHGQSIKVQLRLEDGEVFCAVSDSGIGIPQEEQGMLFNRFYRASNANASRISGIGLGLYISNGIISQHGGRMWVDSQVGRGSTFYFSLPLTQELAATALPSPAAPTS